MAHRATKSGLAAEAKMKTDSKYDSAVAGECMAWIRQYTPNSGLDLKPHGNSADEVYEDLGDGYVLCVFAQEMGIMAPTPAVKRQKMAFKKMELITRFLTACEEYGVPKTELFQTVDLYEKQNMNAVTVCISALARKVNTKCGKGFGPKEAERNSRNFTEEQMKAGQGVIGLQMGSNKGASQAGQNFGKARMIVD